MVEPVARGMYDLCAQKSPTQGEAWETIYPEARDELRQLARAAIVAMRKPTEAMMDALFAYGAGVTDQTLRDCWRLTIDAALAEVKGDGDDG